MIKERLCAPDCKRRNNHGTATLYCALNNLAEHLGCIGVIVDAIAVSRFDDDIVGLRHGLGVGKHGIAIDRKSTRLNSSHVAISYAVFCLKKKKQMKTLLSNN